MSDPRKRPVVGDGTDATDPLVARLARADGPEAPGPSLYREVAARVERRADRRRSGLRAAGALAAVALAGGAVVGLVRATSVSSVSSAGSAASATGAGPSPALGSGVSGAPGAATPGAAAPGTAGGSAGSAAEAAGCPATLPNALPTPTFATATERLVPAGQAARAVICAYPLGIANAASAPAGATATAAGGTASPAVPVAGARDVAADAAWLARVAALPASTDPRLAGAPTACPSTGHPAERVYLVRLAYATGGESWLRVIAGRCEVFADNGAATSARAEGLLAEVRAAYEGGSPLR